MAGVAGAISNGVPDGNGHPNVGMLTIGFEEGGQLERFANCSGSYGGPRVGQPASKVFVTAHCVAFALEAGISANQFWVSFDSEITYDLESGSDEHEQLAPGHRGRIRSGGGTAMVRFARLRSRPARQRCRPD